MGDEPTVYVLDRPGAWARLAGGSVLAGFPLALVAVFSIPGVFRDIFPNARRQHDPVPMLFLSAVALAMVGYGGWLAYTAAGRLRDRRPKLEVGRAGVVDHRGGRTFGWADVVGIGYEVERMGDRTRRAVAKLAVRDADEVRVVDIDIRGLSHPPELIYARMMTVRGAD